MFDRLKADIKTIYERDPAARSILEILFCYPGFHAVWFHRLSHWCWNHGLKLPGRFISHLARFLTGIEIHPGARVGSGFFIDHGLGVVIGETAEIGENVTLYQGVTLGGTSHKKEKRHPTIEDNVIVGANAIVLGPLIVGAGSRIGAGTVVIKEVPPNSTVVGVPGRVVMKDGVKISDEGEKPPGKRDDLDHGQLPDPVAEAVKGVTERMAAMEKELMELRGRADEKPAPAGEQPVSGEKETD